MAEEETKVPGIGKAKKSWVVGGVGAVAAYVGYKWYKSKSAAAAPAVPTDTYATDPNGYGLNTAGGPYNPTGNTGNTTTTTTQILTNADWTNQAVALLSQSGYDPAVVVAALGDFLARRTLNTAEATLARAALASAGQPPVGGPYTVLEQATTGGTGSLSAPKNLRKLFAPTGTDLTFQWDPVTGASHYRIYRSDLHTDPIGDSGDTKFTAQGLTPGRSYSFTVKAVGSTDKESAASNTFTETTAKSTVARPAGLRASGITQTSFHVTCNPVSGANQYFWYLDGHAVGGTGSPAQTFQHLHANTSHKVTVWAGSSSQNSGPSSAPLTVRTKK